MPYASNYTPTTGFATEETNQVSGRSTVRTVALDAELANISSSINGLNTNLKKVQRDDGKLLDGLIEPYALSELTRALIASGGNPMGMWAQNTEYKTGDAVQYSGVAHLCVTPHNSGSVFTQVFWLPISGDGSSSVNAGAAAASALAADTSADLAAASQTAAAASALAADTSADAAALSAIDAANSLAGSILQASQAEAEAGTDATKYLSSLRVAQAILYRQRKTTVASATSADIWTNTGDLIDLTGTANGTGFAAAPQAGASRTLQAASTPSFTLGANLTCNGWASGEVITLKAGEFVTVKAITTTSFALILHQPVTGTVNPTGISFTFANPGNLAVTYTTRTVNYSRVGKRVDIVGDLNASAFTHTTASGVMQITGMLPWVPAEDTYTYVITDGGTWSISGVPAQKIKTNGTIDVEVVSTTNGARTTLTTTNATSGSTKRLLLNFSYNAQP